MQEPQNYGRQREAGDETGGLSTTGGMSPQDERTWSILAHLSVLAALIGLMPLGALVVWLLYKDRSERVAFHALQALWYQVAWLVIFIVGGIVAFVLTLVTFGLALFLIIPIGVLLALVPLAHGCYAAYKASQGADYRYPFVADKVDAARRFA